MIGRIRPVTPMVPNSREAIGFREGVLGLTKEYEGNDDVGFDRRRVEIGVKTRQEREESRGGVHGALIRLSMMRKPFPAAQGVEFSTDPERRWNLLQWTVRPVAVAPRL